VLTLVCNHQGNLPVTVASRFQWLVTVSDFTLRGSSQPVTAQLLFAPPLSKLFVRNDVTTAPFTPLFPQFRDLVKPCFGWASVYAPTDTSTTLQTSLHYYGWLYNPSQKPSPILLPLAEPLRTLWVPTAL
jgi:hypothetical protein